MKKGICYCANCAVKFVDMHGFSNVAAITFANNNVYLCKKLSTWDKIKIMQHPEIRKKKKPQKNPS